MGQGRLFRSGYFYHGIGKNDYLHASPASSAGLGVAFSVHPSKTMRGCLVFLIYNYNSLHLALFKLYTAIAHTHTHTHIEDRTVLDKTSHGDDVLKLFCMHRSENDII